MKSFFVDGKLFAIDWNVNLTCLVVNIRRLQERLSHLDICHSIGSAHVPGAFEKLSTYRELLTVNDLLG